MIQSSKHAIQRMSKRTTLNLSKRNDLRAHSGGDPLHVALARQVRSMFPERMSWPGLHA